MALTARELNRATLARQLLLEREAVTAVEALGRVVAVQAQEPASPYVALWNRVADLDAAELDAAFRDRSIVKASLMRITLHAVTADDYPVLHAAMLPNLRASRLNDRRYRDMGLTTADADALVPDLLALLAAARDREEIDAWLTERVGQLPEPGIWWALRTFMPVHHAPLDGVPWSFGQRPRFRAAPAAERPDPTAALGQLVLRYLAGFGPASIADAAQFALQRRSDLRVAVDGLGDAVIEREGPDGQVLYDLPDQPIPDGDTPAPARLLGMWDSVLLAYDDRSRVVPERFRAHVIRRNGDILPTVLVDGEVAGVWRVRDEQVEVLAFERLVDGAWSQLADEAAGLLAFVGDRDATLYSRYDRWWVKLPEGERRFLPG